MLFSAYGLVIQSDFFFPELTSITESQQPDIKIYRSKLNPPSNLELTDSRLLCSITKDSAYLYCDEVGTFLVKEGKEIIVDTNENFLESVLRVLLLGAAFGLLLHQRGMMVLHGNSVEINGCGVCFIGNRGYGKSTISTALHLKGYPIVSDDVTAIQFINSQPYLIPGYGRVKLWADSLTALGLNPQDLSLVHPDFNKREYLIDQGDLKPVPLKYVYVLGRAAEPTIEPLSTSKALFKIMHNCYCMRFLKQMHHTLPAVEHFQQCSKLVQQTKISYLKRNNDFASIEKLIKLIEEESEKKRAR